MDATEILDADNDITMGDAELYAAALVEKAGLIRKACGNLRENATSLGTTDLLTVEEKLSVSPPLIRAMKAQVINHINAETSIADIVAARKGA